MAKLVKRFEFHADAGFVDRLAACQRDEPDVPSRSEMVRRLVERGTRYRSALTVIRLLAEGKAEEARRLHPDIIAEALKP